jgi:hypothetical protein
MAKLPDYIDKTDKKAVAAYSVLANLGQILCLVGQI